MKTVALEDTDIGRWVDEAQQDRVVLTRDGQPVALLIGLDDEQRQLGTSGELWRLISERREQPRLSRAALEEQIASSKQNSRG